MYVFVSLFEVRWHVSSQGTVICVSQCTWISPSSNLLSEDIYYYLGQGTLFKLPCSIRIMLSIPFTTSTTQWLSYIDSFNCLIEQVLFTILSFHLLVHPSLSLSHFFFSLNSLSTSLMKRRQSSSCQGRATHCTATGSPSPPVTACKHTQTVSPNQTHVD